MSTLFTAEWFEKFCETTKQLTQPTLIDDVFDKTLYNETDILDCLRQIAALPLGSTSLQVYMANGQRADYRAKVHRNPPKPRETLDKWAKRIFGKQKFGIAIYSFEQFNEALGRKFAFFCQAYTNKYGMPNGGFQSNIFIGDYGFTNFGIHQDGLHSKVTQFHLRGKKGMYMWDTDTYIQHTGYQGNCYDIDQAILDKATYYPYPSQGIFFMPPYFYHVAQTHEMTVGITIITMQIEPQGVLATAIATASNHSLQLPKSESNATQQITITQEFAKSSLEDWANEAVTDYYSLLKSNCGLVNSPNLISLKDIKTRGKNLQLVQPFPIIYKQKGESLVVFVRKKRIVLSYLPYFVTLLENWNAGKNYKFSEVINKLTKYWGEDTAMATIALFIQIGGIELK